MILEGIVTTANEDGGAHIAPMGPIVDERMRTLVLRPFRTSTTYENLKRTGRGVLHVTDDVELIAKAAVGPVEPMPPLTPLPAGGGWIIADACRWYAFEIRSRDDSQERSRLEAEVTGSGRLRDFFGFNRGKHAVIEAAILATRVSILSADDIREQFSRLAVLVEKTGGEQERRAFEFLRQYVEGAID